MKLFLTGFLLLASVSNISTAANPKGKETLIITSSPQICQSCSDPEKTTRVKNIGIQYDWINRNKVGRNIAGVVVPGDLVESANDFEQIFNQSNGLPMLTVPYFAGLGAKDYVNHVTSDPVFALRGIRYLRKHVAKVQSKSGVYRDIGRVYFDYLQGTLGVAGTTKRTNAVGNLGYTVELGKEQNIYLIQLNGHVSGDASQNQFYIEGKDTDFSKANNYTTINSVVDWLKNRLEYAAQYHENITSSPARTIIVSMNGSSVDPEIVKLLDTYKVHLRFLNNNGSSANCKKYGDDWKNEEQDKFFCLGYSTEREVLEVELNYDAEGFTVVQQKINEQGNSLPTRTTPGNLEAHPRQEATLGKYPKLRRVVMFSHNGAYDADAVVNDAVVKVVDPGNPNNTIPLNYVKEGMTMYKQHITNNDPELNKAESVKVSFLFKPQNTEVLGEFADKVFDENAAVICVITSGYYNFNSRTKYRLVKASSLHESVPKSWDTQGTPIPGTENQCRDPWWHSDPEWE